MKTAIYPGSFDPITSGHLDIIKRASKIFDKLIILVAINTKKESTFTPEEKMQMIRLATKDLPNTEVDATADLIAKYAHLHHADVIIRGLRNVNDYQDEITLFQFNRSIAPQVDTFVLFPSAKNLFLSSSTIKELVKFNADIKDYVPHEIEDFIIKTIKERHHE